MSGILGFACDRPRPVSLEKLRRALRLLENRGLDGQCVLLHDGSEPSQLLFESAADPPSVPSSRNDMAAAMLACCGTGKDRRVSPGKESAEWRSDQAHLALDGVVDNAPELGRELQRFGHDLEAASQVDVLLAALERWGLDCLSRFTGSFAFATLDRRRRCMILVRDPFGTRPLYIARQQDGALFFASQLEALLEAASMPRRANRASLYRYLACNYMDHDPETFYHGIEQVPPGHYLEVPLDKPGQSSPIRYRRIVPAPANLAFEAAAQCLREIVVRSVASQVNDQSTVGTALSGGFDSSFVAAVFGRACRVPNWRLYTCVPVTSRGQFSQSEEAWADLAAAGLRASLTKVRVTSEDLPASFAALVRLQEEPFSSPVVFAQMQLFRAAQDDGVRLMLSGQGGDTLFTATAEQLLLAVLAQVGRGRWRNAASLLRAGNQLPVGGVRRLAAAAARMGLPQGLRAGLERLRRRRRPDWLREEWFELAPETSVDQLGLPMLRIEDRNSMACSILNRMPLLTTELQDFVSSLPPEHLVTADQPMKSIECAAMRGIVPDAILARRDRAGFPVPVREWLDELAPWVDSNMAEVEDFPFMVGNRVRQIWDGVRSNNESVPAAFLIWRWVFMAGWRRHCAVSLE
jgi:asparagine synthase (glutamine-hydrolysing)